MVDYILREAPPGVLVECGCYQGGSSAKLCLVAAMTARKLYVCDSFEGLPEVTALEGGWRTIAGQQNGFSRGQYGVSLEQVSATIQRHGNLEVCHLLEGFFDKSLVALTGIPIAFVFSDADLVSSTRGVIQFLSLRTASGGPSKWASMPHRYLAQTMVAVSEQASSATSRKTVPRPVALVIKLPWTGRVLHLYETRFITASPCRVRRREY